MVEKRRKVKFAYHGAVRFVLYRWRGCNPGVGLARDVLHEIQMTLRSKFGDWSNCFAPSSQHSDSESESQLLNWLCYAHNLQNTTNIVIYASEKLLKKKVSIWNLTLKSQHGPTPAAKRNQTLMDQVDVTH